jgi:hypothetical protein
VSQKVYNYKPPQSWVGGTGPRGQDFGGSKIDFNAYLKAWDEFNAQIEKATGMMVTGYDPGVNLTEKNDGRWMGRTIQLPGWFARLLIERFEAKNGNATS